MANVHERLMVTAENFLAVSADFFRLRRYLKSGQDAAAALGLLDFLAADPDTPDEIRVHVKRIHKVARDRVSESHTRFFKSRMEPRMSGRNDPESDAAAHVDALDEGFQVAVKAAIEEVG
jgi:hypothetical protein